MVEKQCTCDLSSLFVVGHGVGCPLYKDNSKSIIPESKERLTSEERIKQLKNKVDELRYRIQELME